MEIGARAIRIYASDSQYGGDARTPVRDQPFIGTDFPESGDSVTVWGGPVPHEIAEQLRTREALRSALVRKRLMRDERSVQKLVDKAMSADLTFEDRNFYVTITIDHPISVPDDVITDEEPLWIEVDALEQHDARFRPAAERALDLVTSYVAPITEPALFEEKAYPDVVIFVAEGRPPVLYPRLHETARRISWRKGGFPSDAVAERLQVLGCLAPSDHQWLARTRTWFTVALGTKDPWRRFQAAVFGLEVLTNKLSERYRASLIEALRHSETADLPAPVVDTLVWQQDCMPLAAKFAVVAAVLSPETSENDLRTFRAVKEARDGLSHGQIMRDEELPDTAALDLLRGYMEHATTAILG